VTRIRDPEGETEPDSAGEAGDGRTESLPSPTEPSEGPPAPAELAGWEGEGGAVPAAAPEAVEKTEELPDYKDRWLRAEAELQNYRRRAQRELELSARAAEESVLLELIATVDDLERALNSAIEAGAPESWFKGVSLVVQRVLAYLERQGVSAVDPIGKPFDPAYHDAILEIDSPEGVAPGTVMQVALKGYRRGDRALRVARVVVSRAQDRA